MILLIFLLILDTEVSLCYIHEGNESHFHVQSTGLHPPELLILLGGVELQIEIKNK